MGKLEYVSEVDKEVGMVGAVGVAKTCVDRSKEGMIAIAGLDAIEDGLGKELVEMVGGGGECSTKEDIVVVENAILCL